MSTLDNLRIVIRDAIGAKQDLTIAATAPLQDVVTSSLQFVVIVGEIERVFQVVVPDDYLDPAKLSDLLTVAQLIDRLRGNAA
jgi:acyl carrier protein